MFQLKAKSSSTTLILVSNKLLLFNKYTSITYILLFHIIIYFTFSIPITPTDKQYLPFDNPNITNFMVSRYDCAKQHNLRQFNLLNVKQCTEAPSNIQHANVRAFKCEAYAKKEQKVCFQSNVKYRRVERTVWNHNTMPLPTTLDPLECKNLIRHLNGTDNKILNNLNNNKIFTPLKTTIFNNNWNDFRLFLPYINLTKYIQEHLL